MLAYGFEDLTAAEWGLLEALAARTEVTVSIPYEPGRAVFSSLGRTVEDLAGLAAGDVEELPRLSARPVPAALDHLERELFSDSPGAGVALTGAVAFLEGAGLRGTVELLGSEVLQSLEDGIPPERVAIVCESPDRWRASLDAVFPALGIAYAVEHGSRMAEAPLGRALLALLRFAWQEGTRGDLFTFLRSPFSGLERRSVDFVEGRLRGRAVVEPGPGRGGERAAERGARPRARRASERSEPGRRGARPPAGDGSERVGPREPSDERRRTRRRTRATRRRCGRSTSSRRSSGRAGPRSRRTTCSRRWSARASGRSEPGETGRVAVLDYARARTRLFDVVFLLGLEEGSLPRRNRPTPLLDDDLRRELGGRLERPDSVERDRYLFYTACTRALRRVVLVREAASDDGVPREPSPFWDDVRALYDPAEVSRATRRRALSALTWPLDGAPNERERLRALARLDVEDADGATALAAANGWSRRLERARGAFDRQTRLRSPAVLDALSSRTTFSATELERFADCSSAWLVERVVAPRRIDAEPDPILRGQVVHTALNRFYASLPRELDSERVTPENLDAALGLVRTCLDEALASGVRLDLTDLQAAELRQSLLADLEGFVRDEAESDVAFVPRRLEVAFGSDRAAPELQRGLPLGDGLWLSGKIDRIDVDPWSARGIVQDYKSGKGAHSARDIDRDVRLQIPLYVLALRDLVGLEPLGGIYRALSGKRLTRGMLRESAREDLPGFAKDDYLDEEAFWAQVETARERAATNAQRIRAGDVHHDPRWDGQCPAWCDLWPICRVQRA